MTKLTVAALQLAFTEDAAANIRAVAELVREAAAKGAEVVLPPELFEAHYFCRVEDESLFAPAKRPVPSRIVYIQSRSNTPGIASGLSVPKKVPLNESAPKSIRKVPWKGPPSGLKHMS